MLTADDLDFALAVGFSLGVSSGLCLGFMAYLLAASDALRKPTPKRHPLVWD